jgi:hypothetical protein
VPRQKKKTAGAIADAKANPPALILSDQNPHQIASLRVSDVGNTRTLSIDASPGSYARLMAAFGTKDRDFFRGLIGQIARMRVRDNAPEAINFLFSVVKNTQPRNELEAMLLAQMAACHVTTMDMTSRLNNPEDYRLFLKLVKTFADLKETFDRGRRANDQSFMVQNMTVKDGGQAIVANVTPRSELATEEKTARLTDARAVLLPVLMKALNWPPGLLSKERAAKMTSSQGRNTGPMLSSPRCGARTRSGMPCRSPAVSGKRRCRMHGGAPGSGAPRGNKNALKHGAYTQEAIERRKGIREFIRRSRDLIDKM